MTAAFWLEEEEVEKPTGPGAVGGNSRDRRRRRREATLGRSDTPGETNTPGDVDEGGFGVSELWDEGGLPRDALARQAQKAVHGTLVLGGGVGVERLTGANGKVSYRVIGGSTHDGPLSAVTQAFQLAGASKEPSSPGGGSKLSDPGVSARVFELDSLIADARKQISRRRREMAREKRSPAPVNRWSPSAVDDVSWAQRRINELEGEISSYRQEREALIAGKVQEAVRLQSNRARKGDADYRAPTATPGHGLPERKKKPKESSSSRSGTVTDSAGRARGLGDKGGQFVSGGGQAESDAAAQLLSVQDRMGMAASIRAFQRRHGLKVDGVVGHQTALALTGRVRQARKATPGQMTAEDAERLRRRGRSGRARPSEPRRARGGVLVEELLEGPWVPGQSTFGDWDPAKHPRKPKGSKDAGQFADKPGGGVAFTLKKTGGFFAKRGILGYGAKQLTIKKSAGGSNDAKWAEDAKGRRWLVKAYSGDRDRVATELLSNAIYREMGARVPNAGILQTGAPDFSQIEDQIPEPALPDLRERRTRRVWKEGPEASFDELPAGARFTTPHGVWEKTRDEDAEKVGYLGKKGYKGEPQKGDRLDFAGRTVKTSVATEEEVIGKPLAFSTGVVVREPDGRVWLFEPRGGYGGYDATFPKGRHEEGLTPQQNALKELWEETGLHATITGHVGDFQGDVTKTRYYSAVRTGGKPTTGAETQAVHLVDPREARQMLNRERDRKVLAAALEHPVPKKAPADQTPKYNAGIAVAYPAVEGKPIPHVFKTRGPSSRLGEHFMVDALLGSRDVAGLEDDNILWDKSGTPWRLDQGGTLEFRAMGGFKEFGPVPEEVWTMMKPGRQGWRSSKVGGEEGLKKQAAHIGKLLSDERVDELIDAAPFESEDMKERIRKNLKARIAWMRRFSAGKEQVSWLAPLQEQQALRSLEEGDAGDVWLLQEAQVMSFFWKEDLHPRDVHGKFVEKISGASTFTAIQLDSKTRISKDKDGTWRVVRSGGIIKGFGSASDAARAALDRSAKSTDADSVGGSVKYKDFNEYLLARGQTSVTSAGPSNGTAPFGGKYLSLDDLGAETARLSGLLASLKASGDKYKLRAVPTVEARLKEAKAKYAGLGGGTTGGPPVQTAKTVTSAGGGSVQQALGKFPQGSIFQMSGQTYNVDGANAGQWAGKGIDVTNLATGEKSTFMAETILKHGSKAGVEDVGGPEVKAGMVLQPGNYVVQSVKGNDVVLVDPEGNTTTGNLLLMKQQISQGLFKPEGAPDAPSPSPEVEDFTKSPFGDGVDPDSVSAIGLALKDLPEGVTWEHPKGTSVKVEGKSTTTGTPLYVVTTAQGPLVYETKISAAKALKSGLHNANAKPYKPTPQQAAKKFGKNEKQPVPVDAAGFKVKLKDLALAPGDKIQYQKGGWTYTYLGAKKLGPKTYMQFEDPKGGVKNYTGLKSAATVIKADQSELKLGTPEGMDVTAPAPAKKTPQEELKAVNADVISSLGKLTTEFNAFATQGGDKHPKDLPDGTIIQTPSGKLVRKLGGPGEEGAAEGYVPVWDLTNGAKGKSLPDKPVGKYVTAPSVQISAANIESQQKKAAELKASIAATGSSSGGVGGVGSTSQPKAPQPDDAWNVIEGSSAANHLTQQRTKGYASLSTQEKSAIGNYTGSGYGSINGQLREPRQLGSEHVETQIIRMDSAMAKMPPTEKDLLLWRGVGGKTSQSYKNAVVGSIIRDNGFISASTKKEMGDSWGNVTLKILWPAGSRGLWVGPGGGEGLSGHSGESEHILPHGVSFKVIAVRTSPQGRKILVVEPLHGHK